MYYQKDLGNGTWDVRPVIPVTTSQGNNENPKIYNDTIVYQSDRNHNWDIYMYNITSGATAQITNNSYAQMSPNIDGNNIIWEDNRNGRCDIYTYNLATQTEQRIKTAAAYSLDPSISGKGIIYVRNEGPGGYGTATFPYVYYFNLSTGIEGRLASNSNSFRYSHAVIDQNYVARTNVFLELSGKEDYDEFMRDVTT